MVFGASVASVKFPKTLGKHIPLNIGEREEKKDENQIQNTSVRLP